MKFALSVLIWAVTALTAVAASNEIIQITGSAAITGNIQLQVSLGGPTNPAITTNIWANRYGGTLNDSGTAVAVDAGGNIYAASYYKGPANFGGSTLTNAGGSDICIAKYSSAGVHQWSYGFGGPGDEGVNAIALDAGGNIYVVGQFVGVGNMGSGVLTNGGQYDSFLAKFSNTGTPLWSKRFGSSGVDLFTGVVVDSQTNVIAAGQFSGTVNFGGTNLVSLFGGSFSTVPAVVLAKYTTAGTHVWSQTFVAGNNSYCNGIAIDSGNNLLFTGYFFTSINFGGGNLTTVGALNPNYYIAKVNSNGGYVWQKRYGGTGGDKGMAIATDSNNDVVIGGTFTGQTDLGGGTIIGTASEQDAFIAKYSGTDGSYSWGRGILGNNAAWMIRVACDSLNNVLTVGYYYGAFNFGAVTLNSILLSNDGFAAKYNSSGTPVWAVSFGGSGADGSAYVVTDSNNYSIVSGFFSTTGFFNNGTISVVSAGATDVFIQRIAP